MAEKSKRYAVVTGANKGIGFEICRQLARQGITVVLTARDEKRGRDAVGKLRREPDLSDHNILFHQLDVANAASIDSLADFVRTKLGKLDILVNNAGISGADVEMDEDAYKAAIAKEGVHYGDYLKETYDLAEECLKVNYHGAKRMCEVLIPLLQPSDSPRIVNVSSVMGTLENIENEWAKRVFRDENITEERIDQVLNVFLKDFREGLAKARGWPKFLIAYSVSKAALNAYTRVLAKKHPRFCINSVCPGFVKTDMNLNTGIFSVEEGAEHPVRLALLPDGGPSGRFFSRKEESEF